MKNIFKTSGFLIATIGITLVLGGCFGSGTATTKLKTFDNPEFTLQIDPTWIILSKSEFETEVPKETLAAFTAPEATDGFFSNVTVTKEDLKQEVSSLDYARANINKAGQLLTQYKKLQEVKIDAAPLKTLVHVFEAQLNPTEKPLRYAQMYITKGTWGYIVTGATLPDSTKELQSAVNGMVASFRVK